MSRGECEIFMADCEDEFTSVAYLLREALDLARLNSVQKGICMFLFRRTYGGNQSEDAISLGEFVEACGSSRPYISRQLKELIKKNMICRVSYQPGKTPVYSFITSISQWDPACIDLNALADHCENGLYDCAESGSQGLYDCTTLTVEGLHECTIQGLHICTTLGLHECARVNQPSAQSWPGFEAPLKTVRKTMKERRVYSPNTLSYQLSELLLSKIFKHLPVIRSPVPEMALEEDKWINFVLYFGKYLYNKRRDIFVMGNYWRGGRCEACDAVEGCVWQGG